MERYQKVNVTDKRQQLDGCFFPNSSPSIEVYLNEHFLEGQINLSFISFLLAAFLYVVLLITRHMLTVMEQTPHRDQMT